jgi:hypothetical protein
LNQPIADEESTSGMPPLLGEKAMAQVQKWPWAISISPPRRIIMAKHRKASAMKVSHLKKGKGKKGGRKGRSKKSSIKA